MNLNVTLNKPVAQVAAAKFVAVRYKFDALADNEKQHDDDKDLGHGGFLTQRRYSVMTICS